MTAYLSYKGNGTLVTEVLCIRMCGTHMLFEVHKFLKDLRTPITLKLDALMNLDLGIG
jgi:hypothetical protein